MVDTLLVSISSDENKGNPVLVVGRKEPNEAVKIVNAFYGNRAVDIYNQLITVEKNE